MKKNNPLQKHHFWVLFGLAPLLTLLGVSCINSSVGGKIEQREKEIDDANKAIGGKQNPKPKALIDEASKIYEKVSNKQGDLHKVNWERQKHLYVWPTSSPLLRRFNDSNLKFGDPLPTNEGEFDEFRKREVYIYEFSTLRKDGSGGPGSGMADRVAPTQFRGGWESVLRHVNDFGQNQLTKDQVWLIMEDVWVQRSLLDAVRSLNADMSAFRRAKVEKDGSVVVDPTYDDAGNKLAFDREGKPVYDRRTGRRAVLPTPDEEKRKAVFRNRTWSVELELVREGGSQRLVGTLTNQSERLQLMGVGNVMALNVWFSKDPAAAPMVFKIGGEFLPGKGAIKRDKDGKEVPANVLSVVPIDDHIVPPATSAEEIVRVEQVFDIRTVPVKRIEALALGFLDSRNAGKPLVGPKSPPFAPDPVAADPAAGAGAGPGGPMGMGGLPPAPMGGIGPIDMGPGGPGGPNAGNTTKGQLWGGGPIRAVVDANKKRYLEVTDQVRRLPVGVVVVVDQSYIEDMLLAFANSPLRFQITQVAWTRFRGTLAGIGQAAGSSGPGGGIDFGAGTVNFGGSGDPDAKPGGFRPGPIGPGPIGPMGPMG
ncbi:MAG: hypothetical protein J0I06_09295, partial [Planctomycetes bacterium]|nr:hypothetical protein [Planctomycetota bacterium]